MKNIQENEMIHKLFIWISTLSSIAGIAFVIVEKLGKINNKIIPNGAIYFVIIVGIVLSVALTITEKKDKPDEKIGGGVNTKVNYGSQNIITNPQNIESINIGDTTTNAEKRYHSAYTLIEEELISNYTNLSVLIKGIEEIPPEKFWDIRKPNESEDTFQERGKNFHKEHQVYIFQLIHTFPINKNIYNSHRLDLSHDANIAAKVQKAYHWQEETYDELITYAETLSHNISLNYRDSELYSKNLSLFNEKLIQFRILLLQSLAESLEIYPKINTANALTFNELYNGIDFSSNNLKKKEIQLVISRLYKQKKEIIGKRIKKEHRKEIDRIIKDPYLVMLRKAVGLTDTLSESESWALMHKKIDTNISNSSDLLSAAALSYIESDGSGSTFYLQEALNNNDLPFNIKVFIEKSLLRLKNPDLFEGSIGLIILELNDDSILKRKGLKTGDVIYKMNGEILTEPADISSMIAKTKKEEDVLLEVFVSGKATKRIAIPGSSSIGCKLSQLILLNLFQL